VSNYTNGEDLSGYASALESIERDAWLDIYAAAPVGYAESAGLQAQAHGAFGMLAHRGIGIVEFNRALGIGLEPFLGVADVACAMEWLSAKADSSWVIQPVPGSSAASQIRLLGLKPSGNGWAKFMRKSAPLLESPETTELTVKRTDHASAIEFGRMVALGFGLPSTVTPWFAALVGRPKWHCYLAYQEAEPVACGALYLDGGLGWFGIDATLPEYRNRGAQSALIGRRLADGFDADAAVMTAETSQPSSPDSSSGASYRNYLRAGFGKMYTRLNYRPL
jgi:hypothetical protein